MKNRDYKKFAPDTIMHAYNRGNNREKIFYDNQDYRAFLLRVGLALGLEKKRLLDHSLLTAPNSRIRIIGTDKNLLRLHAFALMPTHFHLLIEQCHDFSISQFVLKVCTSYAMYLNKKYKRVGHVFQDKFKAVLIESNPQLMWTSAYIHMNPVKDKLVKYPGDYEWSSYNDYISKRGLPITYTDLLQPMFGSKSDFEKETMSLVSNQSEVSRAGVKGGP